MADAIIHVLLNASKAAPSSPYTVFSGNTVEITFSVRDENGATQNLTGWLVKYKLHPTTGGDVWPGGKTVAVSDQSVNEGECVLALSASDTATLSGNYNHFLVVTDASSPPAIGTYMTGQPTFIPGGV